MFDTVIMNKEKSIIVGPMKQESLKTFFAQFQKNYPEFLKKNVIVDISKINIDKISKILLFLNTAIAHLNHGTSFVLVVQGIDVDAIPDELVTAPTLVEALDIIEMDEIGRDLFF